MEYGRYEKNPIITAKDVKPSKDTYEVIGVLNCGAVKVGKNIFMLLRVAERPVNKNPDKYVVPVFDEKTNSITEITLDRNDKKYDFTDSRKVAFGSKFYLTSISHIRVAVLENYTDFKVEDNIAIGADDYYSSFGVEDPRITEIDGVYYITYASVFEKGIVPTMVKTVDFKKFEKCGIMFTPDNKDVLLFPGKIDGKYYALNRPTTSYAVTNNMWLSKSPDLKYWGEHKLIASTREGMWDNGRIGGGAVPIKTKYGWLNIYHGATKENRYCMGVMLHQLDNPENIIARSEVPFLVPEAPYETEGFFGNVVFCCAAIAEQDDIYLYYGAADCCIGLAKFSIKQLLEKYLNIK